MTTKASTIISVILTVLTLLVIGIAVFFINIVALNGFSGREGGVALTTTGICGSIGIILSAVVAGRLSKFLITKYTWNNFVVVITSTLASTILGGVLLGIAFVLSVIVAQALFYS
jgi:hypothetical protein